jgi:hypothetical protein
MKRECLVVVVMHDLLIIGVYFRDNSDSVLSVGNLSPTMGARNQVGIGL